MDSRLRTLGFAAAVCVVCASVVSSAAVLLKDRKQANALVEEQKSVLSAAGLVAEGEALEAEEVKRRFDTVKSIEVELATGEPKRRVVYQVQGEGGGLKMLVLPIEGKGLWSTLRGFLALDADLVTIRGITFHSHAETPGLGGEIDNPKWKARWVGRKAFGPGGEVRIEVVKGAAGSPTDDPYRVDGLSGATITARGVSHLVRFWLGEDGFGPYLRELEPKPNLEPNQKEGA